jgi:dihydrofolate reductase
LAGEHRLRGSAAGKHERSDDSRPGVTFYGATHHNASRRSSSSGPESSRIGPWFCPPDASVPVVLTHEPPAEGEWSPQVSFVTGGLDRALELAQEAAGDRYVTVSAADLAQQALRAGKVDEIELSVAPCPLGGGVQLFDHLGDEPIDLEQISVIESEGVTHLRYRVGR